MKRTLAALVLLAALAPLTARAQSSIVAQIAGDKAATEKLYFSLKLGLNFSYLTGSPEEAGRTGGFNVGLSATIRLNDKLSLVPEITPFFRRGISGIPFDTTGEPALDPAFEDPSASELALDYVDVPILLKYRMGRFEIGAGPYLGVLISAKESFRSELETGETVSFSREVTEQYNKTDFGLVVEGSWTVAKPRRGVGLVLHGRYEHGFVDVLRTAAPSGALRNSVWHFYVSFPFVY
ncbi:MAG: porin family protein [Candidatus Aminicenantes bacterium]|nr:porin family protein [Candidatus Aminicenantes bacterium]